MYMCTSVLLFAYWCVGLGEQRARTHRASQTDMMSSDAGYTPSYHDNRQRLVHALHGSRSDET